MPRYTPSLEEFRAASERGNLIPVYRELLADGDTPVSAYAKLGRGPHSFLLESVVGGEKWAAYSFIGVGARALFSARGGRCEITRFDVEGARGGAASRTEGPVPGGDPTRALGELLASYRPVPQAGLPRFFGGAVGYVSYDVVRAFEKLPALKPDELGLPDCSFLITDTLVIFDNLRQTVKVVANAVVDAPADCANIERSYAKACERIDAIVATLQKPGVPLRPLDPRPPTAADDLMQSNTTRAQFCDAVRRAKEYILAGDVFQVVLSQRFSRPRAATPIRSTSIARCA